MDSRYDKKYEGAAAAGLALTRAVGAGAGGDHSRYVMSFWCWIYIKFINFGVGYI